MNILFDFISLQDDYINGASEYTEVVFNNLIQDQNIKIYGIYDKFKKTNNKITEIINKYNVNIIDINDKNLNEYIKSSHIDLLYITIAQRYAQYNLTTLPCKIFITFHDIGDLSQIYDNNINSKVRYEFEKKYVIKHNIKNDIREILQRKYNTVCKVNHVKKAYKNLIELVQNKNVFIITISEYSKYALLYFFPNIKNEIKVFSSPHKISEMNKEIENKTLKNLIENKKEYLLLLNCTRRNKNTALFIEQWPRLCEVTNNKFTALLLGDVNIRMDNIIVINKLSESDLEHAYKNAFCLVYPSISEGYGYPPMEAMKYGTPTVCSNATSLPEIYKNSVLFFNPYYPEDLFRAIIKMTLERSEYAKYAGNYYQTLTYKQENDLHALINYITQ